MAEETSTECAGESTATKKSKAEVTVVSLKADVPENLVIVSEDGKDFETEAESVTASVSEDFAVASVSETEDEKEVTSDFFVELKFDRYGFVKQTNLKNQTYKERSKNAISIAKGRQNLHELNMSLKEENDLILLEAMRSKQWEKILKKPELKKKLLKKEVRKGIPDCHRSKIWLRIISRKCLRPNDTATLLIKAEEKLKNKDNSFITHKNCIERDLHRTLPDHILFREKNGYGQRQLRKILLCYCAEDEKVGYCQGMGFLAAILLTYFNLDDAFFLLNSLLNHEIYEMRNLFLDTMPLVQLRLYQIKVLIKRRLPKLSKHFESLGVSEGMYATHWIITLYSYNFPFELVLRIWDCFLISGWKIIFQIALYILSTEEEYLLTCDFEQVIEHLRGLPVTLKVNETIEGALCIKLKRKTFISIKKTYDREQKKKDKKTKRKDKDKKSEEKKKNVGKLSSKT